MVCLVDFEFRVTLSSVFSLLYSTTLKSSTLFLTILHWRAQASNVKKFARLVLGRREQPPTVDLMKDDDDNGGDGDGNADGGDDDNDGHDVGDDVDKDGDDDGGGGNGDDRKHSNRSASR